MMRLSMRRLRRIRDVLLWVIWTLVAVFFVVVVLVCVDDNVPSHHCERPDQRNQPWCLP